MKNFHNVMPSYFKSLAIIEQTETEKLVVEKIKFLGITLRIKTKHIIVKPDIHKVYILSGPTKGTKFVESYQKSGTGTLVSIDVKLRFNGFTKLFGFLEGYVANQMNSVMDEFISSAEFSSITLSK
jgi:hypothetical protein